MAHVVYAGYVPHEDGLPTSPFEQDDKIVPQVPLEVPDGHQYPVDSAAQAWHVDEHAANDVDPKGDTVPAEQATHAVDEAPARVVVLGL